MSGVNKAILIGNLGRDPEMRYTQDGTPVCNFPVATNETWKDRNSGEKRQKTEWHRIVAFRGLAEVCARYLKKGSKIYIEGKLQTRNYEKDGVTHYITEIVASDMTMLDSAGRSSDSGFEQGGQDRGMPSRDQGGSFSGGYDSYSGPKPAEDDDIPF